MTKSSILRSNKDWDKFFQLKLKHIDSLNNLSQKLFYFGLTFVGAIIVTAFGLAPYIPQNSKFIFMGLIVFIMVFVFIFVRWSYKDLKDEINSYYNKLFYELLVGKIDDIKGISNEEYQKLTEHLKK